MSGGMYQVCTLRRGRLYVKATGLSISEAVNARGRWRGAFMRFVRWPFTGGP